jgi:hypothetical protein
MLRARTEVDFADTPISQRLAVSRHIVIPIDEEEHFRASLSHVPGQPLIAVGVQPVFALLATSER